MINGQTIKEVDEEGYKSTLLELDKKVTRVGQGQEVRKAVQICHEISLQL